MVKGVGLMRKSLVFLLLFTLLISLTSASYMEFLADGVFQFDVNVSGSVRASEYCLDGDCITQWPSGGSGTQRDLADIYPDLNNDGWISLQDLLKVNNLMHQDPSLLSIENLTKADFDGDGLITFYDIAGIWNARCEVGIYLETDCAKGSSVIMAKVNASLNSLKVVKQNAIQMSNIADITDTRLTFTNQTTFSKGLTLSDAYEAEEGAVKYLNGHFYGYNGSEWVQLDGGSGSGITLLQNPIAIYNSSGLQNGVTSTGSISEKLTLNISSLIDSEVSGVVLSLSSSIRGRDDYRSIRRFYAWSNLPSISTHILEETEAKLLTEHLVLNLEAGKSFWSGGEADFDFTGEANNFLIPITSEKTFDLKMFDQYVNADNGFILSLVGTISSSGGASSTPSSLPTCSDGQSLVYESGEWVCGNSGGGIPEISYYETPEDTYDTSHDLGTHDVCVSGSWYFRDGDSGVDGCILYNSSSNWFLESKEWGTCKATCFDWTESSTPSLPTCSEGQTLVYESGEWICGNSGVSGGSLQSQIVAHGLCLNGIVNYWDYHSSLSGEATCSGYTGGFSGGFATVNCPSGTIKMELWHLSNAGRGGESALCLSNASTSSLPTCSEGQSLVYESGEWICGNSGGSTKDSCYSYETTSSFSGYKEIDLLKDGRNICGGEHGCELYIWEKSSDNLLTGDDSAARYIERNGQFTTTSYENGGSYKGSNGDSSQTSLSSATSSCIMYDDYSSISETSSNKFTLRDTSSTVSCEISICEQGTTVTNSSDSSLPTCSDTQTLIYDGINNEWICKYLRPSSLLPEIDVSSTSTEVSFAVPTSCSEGSVLTGYKGTAWGSTRSTDEGSVNRIRQFNGYCSELESTINSPDGFSIETNNCDYNQMVGIQSVNNNVYTTVDCSDGKVATQLNISGRDSHGIYDVGITCCDMAKVKADVKSTLDSADYFYTDTSNYYTISYDSEGDSQTNWYFKEVSCGTGYAACGLKAKDVENRLGYLQLKCCRTETFLR